MRPASACRIESSADSSSETVNHLTNFRTHMSDDAIDIARESKNNSLLRLHTEPLGFND